MVFVFRKLGGDYVKDHNNDEPFPSVWWHSEYHDSNDESGNEPGYIDKLELQ
jgi:hypothetical protein